MVVATRYFGGILLGGGGLVRAYSHTSSIAVKAAGIVCMKPCQMLTLACDYSRYGRLDSLIPECGGLIDDTRLVNTWKSIFIWNPRWCRIFKNVWPMHPMGKSRQR